MSDEEREELQRLEELRRTRRWLTLTEANRLSRLRTLAFVPPPSA